MYSLQEKETIEEAVEVEVDLEEVEEEVVVMETETVIGMEVEEETCPM